MAYRSALRKTGLGPQATCGPAAGIKLARVVVIGGSGQGKSTFLNELAQKDMFAVGSATSSCTQAGGEWEGRNRKLICVNDEEHQTVHMLDTVDTPSFCDPNPELAAQYYDDVVEKCKQHINGVVLVVKPDRTAHDLLERYSVLLRTFIKLEVAMIIVVNGCESRRRRESVGAWKRRCEVCKADFRAFGHELERAAQLIVQEIFVSACVDELESVGKSVARILSSSPAKSSKLNTFAELLEQLRAATQEHAAAKQVLAIHGSHVADIGGRIAALEDHVDSLVNRVPWATVSMVGLPLAVWWESQASAKAQALQEMRKAHASAASAEEAASELERARRKRKEWLAKRCADLGHFLGVATGDAALDCGP